MKSIKPGTQSLLKAYYGCVPKQTMKTVIYGNPPLGVAGVYVDNAKMVMFADISETLREDKSFKRIIILCYRRLLEMKTNLPIYAVAGDIEGSESLLSHIGFSHFREDVWVH